MSAGERSVELTRVRRGIARAAREPAVVEEPLETRLDGEPIAVTMRTPGHDLELAIGFLVTEGVIRDVSALAAAAHCAENQNVVEVHTAAGSSGVVPPAPRNVYASSSCGVCGKATLEALRVRAPSLAGDPVRVHASLLAQLPERLRSAQPLFESTGALHAAALLRPDGELLLVREDVGRHNAVDKLVGWAALRGGLPLASHLLLVSGRAGFEIVQKAWVAGIPIVCAISGPSTLAIDVAREGGLTLVAFLRGSDLNVYSHPERIVAG